MFHELYREEVERGLYAVCSASPYSRPLLDRFAITRRKFNQALIKECTNQALDNLIY